MYLFCVLSFQWRELSHLINLRVKLRLTHPLQRRDVIVLNLTAPNLVAPNLAAPSPLNPLNLPKKENPGVPQPRNETRARRKRKRLSKLQLMNLAKRSKFGMKHWWRVTSFLWKIIFTWNDFNYQQHIYLYTCIKKELNRKVSKRLGEGEINFDSLKRLVLNEICT